MIEAPQALWEACRRRCEHDEAAITYFLFEARNGHGINGHGGDVEDWGRSQCSICGDVGHCWVVAPFPRACVGCLVSRLADGGAKKILLDEESSDELAADGRWRYNR